MAALDSAMVDTDEDLRIDGRYASMKTILQISAAVIAVTTLAWLTSESIDRSATREKSVQAPSEAARAATAEAMHALGDTAARDAAKQRSDADTAYRQTPQAIEMERLRQVD